MEAADRELFAGSLTRAFEDHTGRTLDAALHQLGWRDALTRDRETAVSLLFELQGAANASSSSLDSLLASALRPQDEHVAVVLPVLGGWQMPGELVDGGLAVRGLGSASLAGRASALVVARAHGSDVALEVAVADLTLRKVDGLDPRLGLCEVSGGPIAFGTPVDLTPSGWSAAVLYAQIAIGYELVGAARKMLKLACEHAVQRVQFGQPVASFQAVRHRLADTLIAIETADAMLRSAWVDQTPESASMAKALAGRGARTAARHCQQVLAGIGFTTEHELHHYVRRVIVLDQLFGTALSLTRELGTQLLRTRQLAPLSPL